MTAARDIAARVLVRVDKEKAFAAAALEAEIARAIQLDPRDRAMATELVYGTLRVGPWLDAQLAHFAPRGTDKLDPRVKAHLAIAAYQLFFMRVPAFAAVSEAVDAVRDARGPRVGAFANAVLRKVATQAQSARDVAHTAGTRDAGESLLADAIVASTPAWLRDALDRSLTPEGARAFLRTGVDVPPIALRVALADERDAWVERLRAAAPDASVEPGRVSPLAILVRGAGKPERLPGWTEGAWCVQEEGSQAAALAVGAGPGDTVLDACAGRGNKTSLLARAVGESGAVDACDTSAAKLGRLREELTRLHLRVRNAWAVDWSVGSGEVEGVYDRVLVDAPCSGVGTLRRRPEIALRRQPDDLGAMARAQLAIATHAARHVAPGGSLVYVVCSVLREECEEVVDALAAALPDLVPSPFRDGIVPFDGVPASDAHAFRLLPHVHGTDGYFVAHFVRR